MMSKHCQAMLLQRFGSLSFVIVAFCGVEFTRSVLAERAEEQRKIERAIVQGTERLCSPIFGRVCKAIWPVKTAECLAAEVGCSVRTVAFEISGERPPSAQSLMAVMNAMVPDWRKPGS